jgi:hypothetical protein
VRQAADLLIVLRELFSEYPEAGLAPHERHWRRQPRRSEHRSKLSSR